MQQDLNRDDRGDDIAPLTMCNKPNRSPTRRLNDDEKTKLKESGYCALTLSGPTERVPRKVGEQTSIRPILPSLGTSWNDVTTSVMDRYSPVHRQISHMRMWFESRDAAKRFATELPVFLAPRGRPLRGDWFNLDPDIDLDLLQIELEDHAKSLGLSTFTDEEVLSRIREMSISLPTN